MRGHDLPACWHTFEELRPEGCRPSVVKIRKVKEAIEKDEALKRRVDQIRQEKENKED